MDGAAWVRRGEDCSRGAESASTTGRQKRQATPILFIHDQKGDLQPEGLGMFCLHGSTRLIRDSPDDSRTGADVHGFPAFRQDRSEVRTAIVTSGSPNGGRGVIWPLSATLGATGECPTPSWHAFSTTSTCPCCRPRSTSNRCLRACGRSDRCLRQREGSAEGRQETGARDGPADRDAHRSSCVRIDQRSSYSSRALRTDLVDNASDRPVPQGLLASAAPR